MSSISTKTQTHRNIQITREINATQGFSFINKTEDEAVYQIIEFVVERCPIRKLSKSKKFVTIYSTYATATVKGTHEHRKIGKVVIYCVAALKVEPIDDY